MEFSIITEEVYVLAIYLLDDCTCFDVVVLRVVEVLRGIEDAQNIGKLKSLRGKSKIVCEALGGARDITQLFYYDAPVRLVERQVERWLARPAICFKTRKAFVGCIFTLIDSRPPRFARPLTCRRSSADSCRGAYARGNSAISLSSTSFTLAAWRL